MKNIVIAITCVTGKMVPYVLKKLKQSKIFNYKIIGLSNELFKDRIPIFLDSFYRIPLGEDLLYNSKIIEIVKKEKIEFILPWSDEEAISLSRITEELLILNCKLLCGSEECLNKTSNKFFCYEKLKEAGLRYPNYKLTKNIVELKTAIDEFNYPSKTIVIKPKNSRGGRGVTFLAGNENIPNWIGKGSRETILFKHPKEDQILIKLINSYKELLVMPLMKDPCYDIDVLSFNPNNCQVIMRKRHNPAGIPFQGNTILFNSQLKNYCQEIVKTLNLDGFHDIDLMTNENGEATFLEVNPRPSGSLCSSIAANFPIIDQAILTKSGVDINLLNLNQYLQNEEINLKSNLFEV